MHSSDTAEINVELNNQLEKSKKSIALMDEELIKLRQQLEQFKDFDD